jgi:hypothetical protein
VKQHDARAVLAQFFLDVARTGFAWGLTCCGDICAVHGHGHMCLPFWSDGDVARRMQRRHWPKLVVARIALSEVIGRCLPKAREDGVLVGIGVSVEAEAVVVSAEVIELGLREAEAYLRRRRRGFDGVRARG